MIIGLVWFMWSPDAQLSNLEANGEVHPSNKPTWTLVGVDKNVVISKRREGESKLLAFRGEMIVDAHISRLLGAFVNSSHTLEWADKLKYVEVLPYMSRDSDKTFDAKQPKSMWHKLAFWKRKQPPVAAAAAARYLLEDKNEHRDIMYQLYKQWPLSPRDFVFERNFKVHANNHSVSVLYRSVEDGRKPILGSNIRTISNYTYWVFQSRDSFCLDKSPSKGTS